MSKLTLEFGDDFLLDSAQQRFDEGDYFGALTILNKREAKNRPLADAYVIYADIYEALELWQLAADAWFRFLDTCNEADFQEGYEGLSIAFMNLGNELQSGYYYHRAFSSDEVNISLEDLDPYLNAPQLRLVHAEGMEESNPEELARGLSLLKSGDLEGAKTVFEEIPEESVDFAAGAGLSAMCTLMSGNEDEAEKACEQLIQRYPDNVQILTTYCAVLGARDKTEEAKEIAGRLFALPVTSTDDLYRVATALCETGRDEEAYIRLSELKTRLPYEDNILWFHAVAAKKTGNLDEAIDSLETITTLNPRKAVAQWYLERLRTQRDGGEEVPMSYYYRLPEKEYCRVAAHLLAVNSAADEREFEAIAGSEDFIESFRLAFDEMEGRDEKLQMLAAKAAVKCRADDLLRAVLLDCEGDEIVKISILHDLVCRNEENSFGAVVCNLYKEIFLHELDIGQRKRGAFLQAFADVYAKFAFPSDENEEKLCTAGEDVYKSLAESGAWQLLDERAALSAAIYREARLKHGERAFSEICKLFEANELIVQQILNYLM